MQWFNNVRMAPKLIGSFILVAVLAGVTGGIGLLGLTTVHSHLIDITQNSVPSELQLSAAVSAMNEAMRNSRADVMTNDPAQSKDLSQEATSTEGEAWDNFQTYASLPFGSAREATVASQVRSLLQQWRALDAQVVRYGDQTSAAALAAGTRLSLGAEQSLAARLTDGFDTLQQINAQSAHTAEVQAQDAQSAATRELIAVIVVAVLLALALGMLIARSIARPLAQVQRATADLGSKDVASLADAITALAHGDLTVSAQTTVTPPGYTSRDEIGQTAEATRTIIGKVQETVTTYEVARAQLRELIGQVATSAQQVDTGAGQLAQASTQIGQASTQIARAIEEVARGTTEQSRGSAEVIAQMAELTAAAQQVAGGAEQQRTAVGQATDAIADLEGALRHTTASVEAVTGAATRAAGTARDGGAAVTETIASIESARGAVQQSAEQVAALGRSSAEIGQIVAAIDDIAAQTNLLALNAAIEAARAGEHGKGFTVVAAEVRKLAERSSNETKEITQRIASIQQQVAEVVRAMEVGSAAVEKSATLGQQASSALRDILGVVEETNAQAAAIGTAVEQMTGSVEAVRGAAGQVASVAEQTAQAATRMRGGAERVHVAVESIAAVSEESAASAEEVSASTEEQTAGVEEMAAGAQELAALAVGLRETVGRFVLDAGASEQPAAATAGQVVPRRRATDWSVPARVKQPTEQHN
jgi:methyl-accepting chemotaxis protein